MIRRDARGPGAMKLPAEERPERDVRDVVESVQFYREDLERFRRVLGHYVKSAGARCAVLVNRDGRMIAQAGDGADAANVVGIAAASFETARALRDIAERDRIVQVCDGRWLAVEMSLVGEQTMLAALFGDGRVLPKARLFERWTVQEIRVIIDDVAARKSDAESIAKDFGGRDDGPMPPLAIA